MRLYGFNVCTYCMFIIDRNRNKRQVERYGVENPGNELNSHQLQGWYPARNNSEITPMLIAKE